MTEQDRCDIYNDSTKPEEHEMRMEYIAGFGWLEVADWWSPLGLTQE